ncbi:hypothetical protein MSM1_07975 [Mycobacterium sp. SM1]|uniref:hypothetical protein n=1 Tax=Mycobacterium sp. SM1 TaxID=2816243 RepID=UPI001BCCB034|nr:hypothetical protein [Mycobacterium sp. SM1]MBS4728282.1 hypothetical protein [Mycobacterium sp. SM1]
MSAALAATIASIVTATAITTRDPARVTTGSTVSITAQPSTPVMSALPAAQADRQTCQAWVAAGNQIKAASAAQAIIPEGFTILDPAVQANPAWKAGVQRAAELYGQAGETLAAGIAPGATPILAESAAAAAAALRALATGYKTFDPANGNNYHVMKESSDTMDVLCDRLAPR